MNLLVVNWLDRLNPMAGGAEIHLFELLRRLAERGHRIRLVCSGWPGCTPVEMVDGVEVTRVAGRNTFALAGRRAIRRALRTETPDVVIEDVNKLPLFVATMTDRPVCVVVPHLFGTTAFQEAPWPMAAIVWLAERPIPWLYRRAEYQAISESTRDDLVLRGIPTGRIRVIHLGVDAGHYCPDSSVPRTDPPSFLYVGRLKRYKGVGFAIEALALARKVRPELTLNIAGSGDDRPRLEGIARDRGQGEAVRFLGFVSEAEKLTLLRSTWGNIFPSPKEGWGITVVEAAACGTPSLASDSPGLRDSVRAGETGYLVPHGDAEALAARMLEFAGNPALVERLGQAGRRFAESLSWDRAADLTESHLRDLSGR